jgi:formylglycine-generating enzyme required for sulfatase activity
VNEARLHISGRYRTRLDWAIPVLFSRAETGQLFAFAEARANLTEQVKQEEPPTPPEPVLDPVALNQLQREALIAYYRRDWEQAEVLLAQVADADPTDADVQKKLHEARQQQRLQQQYRQIRELRVAGQWQAVLNALADLEQQYPGAPDPDRHSAWAEAQQRRDQQYDAALQACDQGDWASAQVALEALLRESPDDEAAQGLLVTVRERQRDETRQQTTSTQPPRPAPPKSKPSSPAIIEIAPGVTMEFVEVPAGNFLMGSSDADPDAEADEKPQHELHLPTYWIGKTPVTNKQFRPFVEGDGYSNPDYWTKDGWQEKNRVQPYYWRDKKWNGAEYPVVGIAWYEAMAYVAWLRTRTGDDCRLPTEAEWEKAARGTDGRIYPWGSVWEEGRCNYARGGLMGIFAAQQTSPVGKFVNGASPYGALDMVGNVWEWTRSEFRDYPYDADDGRENVDALAGKWFTLRGGSWYWDRTGVRCAARYRGFPGGSGSDGGCRVLFSPRASP